MSGARVAIVRVALVVLALVIAGAQIACSGVPAGFERVRPTELEVAPTERAEPYLLDVGVTISDTQELRESELERLGTNADIRESEKYFVPFHLRNTLQLSNQWGMVRVAPDEAISDLRVTSRIYRSNGEKLQVHVVARDAEGRLWLDRKYHADATTDSYDGTTMGSRDAYQSLYNTIANDLSSFASGVSSPELERIREVSALRFAEDLAPEVFADYLETDSDGRVGVRRLPSEGDPMMARIRKIRDREDMFIDTLNLYYEAFYQRMWDAYADWRQLNLTERMALKKMKDEAFLRGLAGVLLVAAGVAMGATGDSGATTAGAGVLILVGGQVVIDGINVSQQANIHADAIEELGDSFGSDMKPTVIELEGKRYELTGTVSEQFEEWRAILRRIYLEETGFVGEPDGAGT